MTGKLPINIDHLLRQRTIESDEHRTWFLVRLPVHEGVQPESPEQAAIQATVHETPQVTIHVERLITALTGEMNRTQLQAALRLSNRSHFLAAYLYPALDADLIEMTLPDKPTSRKQRYRRTAAGEALAGKAPNEDSSTQVTIHETIHETIHVEQLITALTGEMNRTQLQTALKLNNRSHFLAAYLHPALDAGLIEMALPDKPTNRKQRYRRTAAGEALAQKIKEPKPST